MNWANNIGENGEKTVKAAGFDWAFVFSFQHKIKLWHMANFRYCRVFKITPDKRNI